MLDKTISPEYLRLNQEHHEAKPSFGSKGDIHLRQVIGIANRYHCDSILDYGCGKGSLGAALYVARHPHMLQNYDPCVPKWNKLPQPADLVVCTDVLEHVEPDYLDNTLDHIKSLTKQVAYLVIATFPAVNVLPDGRNAHLIVADDKFWTAAIMRHFKVRWAKLKYENNELRYIEALATP